MSGGTEPVGGSSVMGGVLYWSASAIWSTATAAARRSARRRVRLPARVISVGNIQAGGAGKTPLVARIAREAAARELRTCVLCRGYGGEWERRGGILAPGEGLPPTGICGDEAALLRDLAPDAWIGIGADRARQYDRARERIGGDIDLVVLDDGFQNLQLEKDVEIVAVTSLSRFQAIFREWPGALKRADLLVWTKGDFVPEDYGKPRVRARFTISGPGSPSPICLVTGLADGRFAVRTAQEAGYKVMRHISFPDHARYAEAMVRGILEQSRRNGLRVAVTGKDWVKWRELGLSRSDVMVLEPELELSEEDRKVWDRILWGS